MITQITTPEALDHDLVSGKWPHELVPITVHFLRRIRKRRTNVTEALVKLVKLPPCVRFKGSLYLPDPKTPGGPFQEKHTEKEYVWLIKRWIKLPEDADPGKLSVKLIARCTNPDCKRVWMGDVDLCPSCTAVAKQADSNPEIKAISEIPIPVGRVKTEPPPDSDTVPPPPDTQSSPWPDHDHE